MSKEEVEQIGFKVMAQERHLDGLLSFDAHRIFGRRCLVKGDPMPTYHAAMAALYLRCQEAKR